MTMKRPARSVLAATKSTGGAYSSPTSITENAELHASTRATNASAPNRRLPPSLNRRSPRSVPQPPTDPVYRRPADAGEPGARRI